MVCIKKIVSPASLLGRLTSYCSSVKWPKASFSLHGSYCGITVQERIVLNPRSSNLRSLFQVRPKVGLNILFKIPELFFHENHKVLLDTHSALVACSSKIQSLNIHRNLKNLQLEIHLCHFIKAFMTNQAALQSRKVELSILNLSYYHLL